MSIGTLILLFFTFFFDKKTITLLPSSEKVVAGRHTSWRITRDEEIKQA
jgi:hypothetical protein